MKEISKGEERNAEIVSFFYLVFGNRVHAGMKPDEARKEAYDAVTLRYNISAGRLLNIISSLRNSPRVNERAFRQNTLALIDSLSAANTEMDARKEKNEKLISLLKECLDESR